MATMFVAVCWIFQFKNDGGAMKAVASEWNSASTLGELPKFLNLFEHFPEVIYCAHATPERPMIFMSGGVFSLTGHPPDHFIGEDAASINACIYPKDCELVATRLQDTLNQDHPFSCEYRILTADDEVKWVWEHAKLVRRQPDDEVPLLEGMIIDVTQIKERDETDIEYLQFQDRIGLLQKEDSLHRVMGSVAHLFNNKLHAVLGYLEMATLEQRSLHRYDVIGALKPVQDCLMDAARISANMLSCAGQVHHVTKHVNILQLCEQIHAAMIRQCPSHVEFRMSSKIPESIIMGDPDGLRAMIRALILNAFEAPNVNKVDLLLSERSNNTFCTHGYVCIHDDFQEKQGPYICITVRDDGAGISPTMMRQIFDPFYSTKFLGRGIGLTVALEQLRAHGGCMCVCSSEDEETTFTACLPLLVEPDCNDSFRGTAPATDEQKARQILVVDDELPLVHMVGMQVRKLGYTPIKAGDYKEAMSVVRAKGDCLSAVISDIRMPGKSGWDLLVSIREKYPLLPVILMSAYKNGVCPPIENCPQPSGFLHKPYLTADLGSLLASVMAAASLDSQRSNSL